MPTKPVCDLGNLAMAASPCVTEISWAAPRKTVPFPKPRAAGAAEENAA
jgi:hypothetical protein